MALNDVQDMPNPGPDPERLTNWRNWKKFRLWFTGAYYTSAYGSFATLIADLGSRSVTVYVNSAVSITANLTIPSNISIVVLKGGSFAISVGITLTIQGAISAGPFQIFSGLGSVKLDGATEDAFLEWFGGAADSSTNNDAAIDFCLRSYALASFRLALMDGNYKYATSKALNASHNGLAIIGRGRFNSLLWYTGSGDGITIGSNCNGLDWRDFRIYSTTGRDAISITDGAATAIPDAGVLCFSHLDIRGWLRHGIKARLTVDVRTDHLEVVQNGGCGLYVENANPYRSTTWTDTSSWFHENGGHGIAIKGTFTHTFNGTISDSNTGLSADVDTISCAGYTLIGGGVWANCIEADIGKSVTQGGVTVGTLAHYDNTDQHMIINCTTIPSGAGALAITTGTGASTASTFRKNSHGLYAARSAYINIQGGHYENHQYGIFLDSAYQSTIMPGYFLTQGVGAWGLYCASLCRRIVMGGFGSDVQAGGSGDIYFGPLTKAMILHGGHGATGYTFTNRSPDSYVLTSEDDNPLILKMKSSSAQPVYLGSSHAAAAYIYSVNTSTTGDMGYSLSVNGWTLEFYLQQSTGNIVWKSTGQSKFFGLYGSGGDRADQRLFWATNDGQKTISIGPTTGQMTGLDVEADYTVDLYDDAGTLIGSGLSIIRATRLASIMAGKSASTRANVGGVISQSVANTGNVNAAETDLWTYSVPANMLARNGDSLRVTCGGTTAANANTKRFRAYFGATSGLNTGALALNNSQWNMELFIQRLSATTQLMVVRVFTNDALLFSYSQTTNAAETLSGAVTFRLTATATTTNDAVCNGMQMRWDPGA